MNLKKGIIILLSLFIAVSAKADEKIELGFFADQETFTVEDRKKLVALLEKHKDGDLYEFELLSLSDPLKSNLDVKRLTDIQAIFRQYGVYIDGLLSAKIRFIASDKQKLVIIKKSNKIVEYEQ